MTRKTMLDRKSLPSRANTLVIVELPAASPLHEFSG
jgi:hypothetical protein